MATAKNKSAQRARRHARVRAKIQGTALRPRLSVFKSNRDMYAQIIDDVRGVTLAAASTVGLEGVMREQAGQAGKLLAKNASVKKITKVVFDRGGYRYLGNVKAFADGAREGGLIF